MEEATNDHRQVSPEAAKKKVTKHRKWTKIRSLDGAYGKYTTAVLTTMSLGITILFFERGFLQGRAGKSFLLGDTDDIDVAGKKILRSFILLLAAGVIGAVSHLILVPNLKTMENQLEVRARRWVFYSMIGVVFCNTLAVLTSIAAEHAFQHDLDNSSFVSPISHYLLLVAFLVSLASLDILYLRVILLPFVDIEKDISRAQHNWKRIRSIVFYHHEILQEAGQANRMGLGRRLLLKYYLIVDRIAIWALYCTRRAVNGFQRMVSWGIQGCFGEGSPKDDVNKVSNKLSSWREGIVSSTPVCFITSSASNMSALLSRMFTPIKISMHKLGGFAKANGASPDAPWHKRMLHGFVVSVESADTAVRSIKPTVKNFFVTLWDDVKEDKNFRHSSWVKGAVITSTVLLFYFGLYLAAVFQRFYHDIYLPRRQCAEDNPKVTDFFLRTIGYSESVPSGQEYMELDSMSPSSLEFIKESFSELDEEKKRAITEGLTCPKYDQSDFDVGGQNEVPLVIYAAIVAYEEERALKEMQSPAEKFRTSSMGSAMYVLDVLMHNMDWSIWLGLVVGIVIGIYSLLSVFAQYKKMSFAIRSDVFDQLPRDVRMMVEGSQSKDFAKLEDHEKWGRLFKVYPMSLAVFFFGMLVSTAVLQLAVFGILVSILLAGSVSLFDPEVYRILKPFIAFLIAFLITWIMNGFLATKVLGDAWLLDGDTVVHEMGFLLYLLVYTAVHLVLGVFLAIVRLLILLVATFSKINRLDRNLFVTFKALDRGHKSFVAMVLLQFAFQTAKSPDKQGVDSWVNVLSQLQARRGDFCLRFPKMKVQDADQALHVEKSEETVVASDSHSAISREAVRESQAAGERALAGDHLAKI